MPEGRASLGKCVQTRAKNNILSYALSRLFRNEVFDEAGATHD
jgi:hypothetical protein